MTPPNKCSAIKSLLLLALLGSSLWAEAATAAGAGSVAHLSGALFARKLDGSVRILGAQSTIEVGDTVSTSGNGYAQIRFSDDSLLTLKPDTVVSLDGYAYDAAAPAADLSAMTLKQGSVRTQPGKIGQRSKDRVTLVTALASIGLQASDVVVQYQPLTTNASIPLRSSTRLALMANDLQVSAMSSDSPVAAFVQVLAARYAYRLASAVAWLESRIMDGGATVAATTAPTAALPPGLYVAVIDGLIHVTNPVGTQSFSAGQFGYTASTVTSPVVVPKNPGLAFTPPPTFSIPPPISGATTAPKSNAVDCVVR